VLNLGNYVQDLLMLLGGSTQESKGKDKDFPVLI